MSNTALIEAVKVKDMTKVKALLNEGADVNEKGNEQEWPALNFAAGKGDLEMIKLLVDNGADVFNTGRDNRTPYKIAIAACRKETARYLVEKEEEAGGDKEMVSSREWLTRPYCKAYSLRDLRKFPGWSEQNVNWKDKNEEDMDEEDKRKASEGFIDDDVVFIHQDTMVTESMWYNENVLYNDLSDEWKAFCEKDLGFKVPTDFDLVPDENPVEAAERADAEKEERR